MKISFREGNLNINYDTDNIKDVCASCKKNIINNESRYKSVGNYCSSCNVKCSGKTKSESDLNKFRNLW